ncbi:plasmid mobilization relaxosome protein MobC [Comamonas jiangduensis]|uniref:plasmid mobilization relaxosome protein MobC n=1 Tax=Comamonas jiangduensis TaxID=1194168 RepID=UPI003BF78C41
MNKSKSEKRANRIEIHLSTQELEALKNVKGPTGTLARYAREKLLSTKAIAQNQKSVSQYLELVNQIKKIGVNVNQIAHQINAQQFTKVQVVIELKNELNRLREIADIAIHEAIKK